MLRATVSRLTCFGTFCMCLTASESFVVWCFLLLVYLPEFGPIRRAAPSIFFLIDVVLFKPQYEITQAPLSNLLSDYAVEITAKHFYLQNSCNWLNGFNRKSLVLEIKTETITIWFPHCLVFVFFCYFLISCSPQSNSLRTCLVYVAHFFFFSPLQFIYLLLFFFSICPSIGGFLFAGRYQVQRVWAPSFHDSSGWQNWSKQSACGRW